MLKLGIVGTGMMAGIIAGSAEQAGIQVHSVLSRSQASREKFSKHFNVTIEKTHCNPIDFFSDQQLEAVYIATPTSTKEKFLRLCIKYRKHALIEKPFPESTSFLSLLSEAERLGLVWLDAAHFIHNPFNCRLRDEINAHVGVITRITASFIWPDTDRGQIKFSPELEPDGAHGDLGWYPARIISEFIDVSNLDKCTSFLVKNENGAIIESQSAGYTKDNISFSSIASYRGSVCEQICLISGTTGQLVINDFVMPYCGSFVYGNLLPHMTITLSKGLKPLIDRMEKKYTFPEFQHITMLKNFSQYVHGYALDSLSSQQRTCIRTMRLLSICKKNADISNALLYRNLHEQF